MKILSLDTAMAACSAAVVDSDRPLPWAEAFLPMARGHAETLPPMVAEVVAASGLKMAQLDRIAVTVGPGTFTGVRIGLSFARGLGLALGIPVIGLDSLTAIAANETTSCPLLVVADGRNGEVYAAVFDQRRQLVAGPRVVAAAQAAQDVPAGTLLIGTAAAAVLAASGRTDLSLSPAGNLPEAARFAHLAASMAPGEMPAPLYLRAPDAKPQAAPLRRLTGLSFDVAGIAAASLLAQLHAEIFQEGWSAKAFDDLLRMPGANAVLARQDDEAVGFVLTRRAVDEAEIITIGTRPSAQRRGVARQLLERQLTTLAQEGVKQVFLEVAASNMAAQALYSALGFAEAGRRKGYYRRAHGVEDAVVMRRELAS